MAGRLAGKVAFIAARGQGRAHAVRFAEEGADIIAVDMGGPEDLAETVNLVEKTGRRIVAEHADIRDFAFLQSVLANGVAELGRVDFVLANAGVAPRAGLADPTADSYVDAIDVVLNGIYFTIEAALPHLLEHEDGGAIVITSATAGFTSIVRDVDTRNPGLAGYAAAEQGVIGLMRYYATALAEKEIRVNSVHPTGVATLDEYAEKHPAFGAAFTNLLPVSVIGAEDVSAAMIYLCAKSGRYITGTTLTVDAGMLLN